MALISRKSWGLEEASKLQYEASIKETDEIEEDEEDEDQSDVEESLLGKFEQAVAYIKKKYECDGEAETNRAKKQSTYAQATAFDAKEFDLHYRDLFQKTKKAKDSDDLVTLLHLLVKRVDFPAPVGHVIRANPSLMKEQDKNNWTPLCNAIELKKKEIIEEISRSIVDDEEFDILLRLECGMKRRNSIHTAIVKKLDALITIKLIRRASEETLSATDSDGCTPLHLAVAYERCTASQLGIVQELLKRGNKALDVYTAESPTSPRRSVIAYHELTRDEFIKSKASKVDDSAIKTPEPKGPPVLSSAEHTAPNPHDEDSSYHVSQFTTSGRLGNREGSESLVDADGGRTPDTNGSTSGNLGHLTNIVTILQNSYNGEDSPTSAATSRTKATTGQSSGAKATEFKRKMAIGSTSQKRGQKATVTSATATKVRDEVVNHYLRTTFEPRMPEKINEKRDVRTHKQAIDFLFGTNTEGYEICFDLSKMKIDMKDDEFNNSYDHIKFSDVLCYVAVGAVKLQRTAQANTSKSPRGRDLVKPGLGRTCLTILFDWLRKKGVKKILKVIVDDSIADDNLDLLRPGVPHTDDAIEQALHPFHVEMLDWRKPDMCPQMIRSASDELRELWLTWGGNNTILRAWSAQDGLPLLEKLEVVHIHAPQGLESSARRKKNLDNFKERLCKAREPRIDLAIRSIKGLKDQMQSASTPKAARQTERKLQLKEEEKMWLERGIYPDVDPEDYTQRGTFLSAGSGPSQPDRGRQTHRWLACMDDFADRIQNINPAKLDAMKNEKLGQPIKVALIDDGVNTSHRTIQGKIQGGMSFDPGLENRPSPYYVTETGHGTVMADLICRVCPVAKLQIFKLETYVVDHNNGGETNRKTQITARSAAQAIEAAVERHADIISMSWTIKNSDKQSDELKLLETAMQKAIDAKILVFCSASDEGTFRNTSDYPSHTHASRVFRIGAATVDGVPCTWVDREVEFILPGQDVSERRTSISEPTKPFRPMTGSSVATALAAGLAALILHCVKLAAIAEGDLVKKEDLDDMHGYAKMKGAFNRMTPKDSKFIEVSELFGEKEVKDLDECSNDDTKKLVVVADIARKLVDSAKLSSR